jgi:TRAP-type transport system periplasmic protein
MKIGIIRISIQLIFKRRKTMKKQHGFILSMILLFCLVLSGCSESSSAGNESANKGSGDVYELDINNWASSTHHYAYNVYEPWKKLVEEKTDGRVKVNIYHGSALGKSSSVYQDVEGGLYDVGAIVANYFYDTGFFPYTIGNLPFALEGPEESAAILKKFAEKYAKEDLTSVVLMDPTATDGYDLFSTSPIKSVDDLKNLKMRVNGKSENAFVEAIGGVPVSLSTEDTYEGLEKGTIDTAFYTPIGGVGLKFHEPAPYITKFAVSVTPIVPIMNKEFFDGLPKDLQTLFEEELNPELTKLFTESYEKELETSHEELKKQVADRGEFITLPESEMKKFREFGKDAWDAWIKDADKKGYDGQAMADEFKSMLEEAGYPTPY